jgi:hypothetical protein
VPVRRQLVYDFSLSRNVTLTLGNVPFSHRQMRREHGSLVHLRVVPQR